MRGSLKFPPFNGCWTSIHNVDIPLGLLAIHIRPTLQCPCCVTFIWKSDIRTWQNRGYTGLFADQIAHPRCTHHLPMANPYTRVGRLGLGMSGWLCQVCVY